MPREFRIKRCLLKLGGKRFLKGGERPLELGLEGAVPLDLCHGRGRHSRRREWTKGTEQGLLTVTLVILPFPIRLWF